jgi:hypothetical protein
MHMIFFILKFIVSYQEYVIFIFKNKTIYIKHKKNYK